MTETTKTILFVAVAAVAVTLAVVSRPTPPKLTEDVVGQPVSADFNDPLAVTSMEIVDFDQETGTPKRFKVARVKGVWSLPSRYDYPADAEQQLAAAATSLSDLEILQLVSNTPSEHGMFGVIEPTSAEPGAEGVGKHVTLADESGKKLLDVVIGKEVRESPGLRYVRPAGKSQVYVVKVGTDKLTTKFEDWIEKDLLKLNAWDISRIFINNYSIDEVNRRQVPGDVLDLTYDDKEGQWKLADLKEDEELDTTKLNELKTALDDLKIVDVRRKPAGLSRDLKTEEGINLDEATLASLLSRGFYPTQSGDLLSNEGEVVVGTKDGVQYVLRFGEIALGTEQADADPQATGEEADGQVPEKGANRYLFLMAQFDPSLIEKPELTPVPGESQVEAPAEAKATQQEDSPDAESEPVIQAPSEGPSAPDDEAAESDTDGESKVEDSEEGTVEPAETATEAQPEAQTTEATPEQIALIKAENKRKQDEYDQKIKKGQEKVKELNDRFADWYYVISNDVYRKIKLNRQDALKQPEGAAVKDSPAEFEQLKQGLDAGLPAAP